MTRAKRTRVRHWNPTRRWTRRPNPGTTRTPHRKRLFRKMKFRRMKWWRSRSPCRCTRQKQGQEGCGFRVQRSSRAPDMRRGAGNTWPALWRRGPVMGSPDIKRQRTVQALEPPPERPPRAAHPIEVAGRGQRRSGRLRRGPVRVAPCCTMKKASCRCRRSASWMGARVSLCVVRLFCRRIGLYAWALRHHARQRRRRPVPEWRRKWAGL